jgi:hypothetical protein
MSSGLPACFGKEYIDESGDTCPHEDCYLRYDCGRVYNSSFGLRAATDAKIAARVKKKNKEAKKKADKKAERDAKVVAGIPLRKDFTKRSGYWKPGRLLYKDEGSLRDAMLSRLREYLSGKGFQVRATKCLHSFSDADGKFLLKVDTRRKNSLHVYVGDALHRELATLDLKSRPLFISERPNFPWYLSRVVVIDSESFLERALSVLDDYLGAIHDLK